MTFGEKFKAEREKQKLTQQEVADALGINRRMITRYENGISFPRTKGACRKIADLKRCSMISRHKASYEADEMERLKAEGREKSATYRQFFGNRLFYKQLLNTYKKYGLMD